MTKRNREENDDEKKGKQNGGEKGLGFRGKTHTHTLSEYTWWTAKVIQIMPVNFLIRIISI